MCAAASMSASVASRIVGSAGGGRSEISVGAGGASETNTADCDASAERSCPSNDDIGDDSACAALAAAAAAFDAAAAALDASDMDGADEREAVHPLAHERSRRRFKK